jgi:hypothetical protein
MQLRSNEDFFYTKLANNYKTAREQTPNDVSADFRSGMPSLPWWKRPSDGLGWLLYASAQAGWHQGGIGTTAAAMVE